MQAVVAEGPLVMPEEKKLKLPTKYCESIHQTIRRPTRTIHIGKVETGSAHPVRLQTMTTTGELAPSVVQIIPAPSCRSLVRQPCTALQATMTGVPSLVLMYKAQSGGHKTQSSAQWLSSFRLHPSVQSRVIWA